jgi:hypothetical protein
MNRTSLRDMVEVAMKNQSLVPVLGALCYILIELLAATEANNSNEAYSSRGY